MAYPEIKEYLTRAGIRRITRLDETLLETFGQTEGERHIEKLTELFDLSEKRMMFGSEETDYLRRQEELVDYLNQSLEMSLLAASFYDRIFFRKVMEYVVSYGHFEKGDIFDLGCGNGILTCFLALGNPESSVTGLDLSSCALSSAKELADRLQVRNVDFTEPKPPEKKKCGTLFSCRTAHENVPWRTLLEESTMPALTLNEQIRRHEKYAEELSSLMNPQGYLISVERYEDDNAYAGFLHALENAGFSRIRGTHMQFSCRNGDETAVFQAIIMQKA